MMMKKLAIPAFGLFALAVAACGGGGGSSSGGASTLVPVAQGKQSVKIVLHVPTRIGQMTPKLRARLNEAQGTQGLLVTVYPNPQGTSTPAATAAFDVSSGSSLCTVSAADQSRNCNFAVDLLPGAYVMNLASYNAKPANSTTPAGTQIGIGSTTATVAVGSTPSPVAIVLNGIASSVGVSLPVQSLKPLNSLTQNAIVSVFDADNDLIVSPNYVDSSGNPVTVAMTVSGAANMVSLGTTSFTAPQPNGVAVTYDPTHITATMMGQSNSWNITATLSNNSATGFATLGESPALQTIGGLAAIPYGITAQSAAGTLWVTEPSANQVQSIIPQTNSVAGPVVVNASSAPLAPTPGPKDIVYASDGNLWMTFMNDGAIGRMSTLGSNLTGTSLYAGTSGVSIAGDGIGNVWTTQPSGNYVEFEPIGGFTVTQLNPATSTGIFQITAGTGGMMWFTSSTASQLGVATAASPAPSVNGSAETLTPGSSPEGIAWDGNQMMWVAESGTNKIAQVIGPAPGASINEYSTGTAVPTWITVGADGNAWFDYSGPTPGVGRVTPNGVVSLFPLPAGSVPWQMVSLGLQVWIVDNAHTTLYGINI